jgi:hypothetical protein
MQTSERRAILLALAGAIMVIALALLNRPARAAGLLVPLPPVVRPMSRSCWETAVQLGYQTGSARHVALAAIEACRGYAPVPTPRDHRRFSGARRTTPSRAAKAMIISTAAPAATCSPVAVARLRISARRNAGISFAMQATFEPDRNPL